MVQVAVAQKLRLGERVKEWERVIKLSRKPRKSEYLSVAKVTGAGMILIGTLAFILRLIIHVASSLVK
ncbi:MAG: protein translocase SEC61 complex subunit gamma [Euryarchaeota archaeon]|nr:protein translocase SEC61 complex subunit gamma [Euryarchaeota archaeon]